MILNFKLKPKKQILQLCNTLNTRRLVRAPLFQHVSVEELEARKEEIQRHEEVAAQLKTIPNAGLLSILL